MGPQETRPTRRGILAGFQTARGLYSEDALNRRLSIAVIALALLWGLFIWPTQYRYSQIQWSGLGGSPVRINRFTGHAQVLVPIGWKNLERSRLGTARPPRDPLESLAVKHGIPID